MFRKVPRTARVRPLLAGILKRIVGRPLKPILVGVVILASVTIPARADKVHLHDGRVVSGFAERNKDGSVTVTYPRDPKETFAKELVKKIVPESRATAADVLQMLTEFEGSIADALGIPPDQRKLMEQWGSYESEDSGSSGTYTHKSQWTTQTEVGRLLIKNDEFVEKWNEYAALFASIAGTERYKKQTRYVRGQSSLREFADDPPEELMELSTHVGNYLKSVRTLFSAVETAEKSIENISRQEINLDEAIRQAQDRVDNQKIESQGSKDRGRRKNVGRAQATVEKLSREKMTAMDRLRQHAQTAKMDAASSRIDVLIQLRELHVELDKHAK
ncbi:MAG: hypothetical protein HOP29_01030 [Phycisphaerales bacterium]|nr:hypothetical protein [Phycisphaerales bacterium]